MHAGTICRNLVLTTGGQDSVYLIGLQVVPKDTQTPGYDVTMRHISTAPQGKPFSPKKRLPVANGLHFMSFSGGVL